MKLLLLLFVSRLCLSSVGYDTKRVKYGETVRLEIRRSIYVVEFTAEDSWSGKILWKQDEHLDPDEKRRWKVTGNSFIISNVTQRDIGVYSLMDKAGVQRSITSINVYTPKLDFSLKEGDFLQFSGNVQESSCNIVFFPERGREIELVREGVWVAYRNDPACSRFSFSKPCFLFTENVQSSCDGRFEVRDEYGDLALEVFVEMQSIDPMYFAIGGGILAFMLISCCAMRCCCRQSSSQTKPPAVSEAVVRYNEYDREPAGQRQNQLSQPSRATTGPLIHGAPTSPPAYSTVYSRAEQPDGAAEPLCSDPEPRFELKGLNFNFTPPLSSDSTDVHVYTSNKLNFP
ncbi:unnamed protein product [Ophioblennius macclurei]